MYFLEANTEEINVKGPEICYASNLYKTKVFGIQKTDQEIEINESFGFRVKIELEPHELLKMHKESFSGKNIPRDEEFVSNLFNYETVPFFMEVELYHLKWKFWEMKPEQIKTAFIKGKMTKAQSLTLSMQNPVKGLWNFLFINFNEDFLSQWVGTVHSLLLNFQQGSKISKNKLKKSTSLLKENEDYVHVGLRSPENIFTKTLSERNTSNNPFNTSRQQNVLRLKRLDKVCLDDNGNRWPTNLTEFLFGDQESGYYLSRDTNLKWYVTYSVILRIFTKVLNPLYKSYETLKKQFEHLSSIKEVKNIITYNKNLQEGINELHLFTVPASEANLVNEFKE
jgi:hypothetical protein